MSNKYKKSSALIWATLAAHFPNCFYLKAFRPKPLKVNIDQDILAYFPEMNPRELWVTLAKYTGRSAYQQMLVEGMPRYNLNGEGVGVVSEREATFAASKSFHAPVRPPNQELAA